MTTKIDRRPDLHCPSCDAIDGRDYDFDLPAYPVCRACGAAFKMECVYEITTNDPPQDPPQTTKETRAYTVNLSQEAHEALLAIVLLFRDEDSRATPESALAAILHDALPCALAGGLAALAAVEINPHISLDESRAAAQRAAGALLDARSGRKGKRRGKANGAR